jgi:hypothetical protein
VHKPSFTLGPTMWGTEPEPELQRERRGAVGALGGDVPPHPPPPRPSGLSHGTRGARDAAVWYSPPVERPSTRRRGADRGFTFHVVSPFRTPEVLPAGVRIKIVGTLPELGGLPVMSGAGLGLRGGGGPPGYPTVELQPSARHTSSRVLESSRALKLGGPPPATGPSPVTSILDALKRVEAAYEYGQVCIQQGDDAAALACCRHGSKAIREAQKGTRPQTRLLRSTIPQKYASHQVQAAVRRLGNLQDQCERTWFRFTVRHSSAGSVLGPTGPAVPSQLHAR